MDKEEKKPRIRFEGFTDAWEQRKFSEVFNFMQNNALSRAELSSSEGEIMNVHYGDILVKYGEVLDVKKDDLTYLLDASIVKKYQASVLHNGDVIIADAAEDETVGKCSEIAGLTDEIVLSGLHTIPCRPKEKYAKGYLGYYMNSNAYHNQLLPLLQGTKVSSISKSAIQDTDIIYPKSEVEQRQIGAYFSNLDHLITLHQRKYDKLQRIKKSMLQKMFPQNGSLIPEIRFEGFTDAWEQRKLGDSILECTQRTSDFIQYPLHSLTIENGVTEKTERYERSFLITKEEDLFKIVPPKCFVTNPMNLRFGAIGYNQKSHEISVSGYYDVFSIDDGECSEFWQAYLKTHTALKKYDDVATGSLIEKRRVHFSELKKIDFLAPVKMEEKQKIGDFFANLDYLITLHQRKLEKLKNIKKSMLEKMFV